MLNKMYRMRAKMHNKKGFTLMEMLIVVAIIAILVAIAIPVFSAQLNKARAAVDKANIRSAYAMFQIAEITGDIGLELPDSGTQDYYFTDSGALEAVDTVTIPATAYQLQADSKDDPIPSISTLVLNTANRVKDKYIVITYEATLKEFSLSFK